MARSTWSRGKPILSISAIDACSAGPDKNDWVVAKPDDGAGAVSAGAATGASTGAGGGAGAGAEVGAGMGTSAGGSCASEGTTAAALLEEAEGVGFGCAQTRSLD